ncbi:E3 ubiquitin-protein ligase EL5-like [Zingiber officinale]|nr:E3 ubiquitin-protein ligase EL5-like [Zingiber officinale]XP_042396676.1 E3 ubiquitin-protein ligase EL5-like [Zingiber officinale]
MWAVYLAIGTVFAISFGIAMLFAYKLWFSVPASLVASEGKAAAGLSTAELDMIAGDGGGAVVDGGQYCAVCLEEMEEGQAARVLPECRHAFHRECVDRWLARHRECPLCRAVLRPPRSPPVAHVPTLAV